MLLAIGHEFLLNLNVPHDFTTDRSLGCHFLRYSMFKLQLTIWIPIESWLNKGTTYQQLIGWHSCIGLLICQEHQLIALVTHNVGSTECVVQSEMSSSIMLIAPNSFNTFHVYYMMMSTVVLPIQPMCLYEHYSIGLTKCLFIYRQL